MNSIFLTSHLLLGLKAVPKSKFQTLTPNDVSAVDEKTSNEPNSANLIFISAFFDPPTLQSRKQSSWAQDYSFLFFILSNCARGMPQRWGDVSRSIYSAALRGNQFQKTQKLYRVGWICDFFKDKLWRDVVKNFCTLVVWRRMQCLSLQEYGLWGVTFVL